MKPRVLHLLLRLYPRKWRDRYEEEVADLTDELLERREAKPFHIGIGFAWSALLAHVAALRCNHRAALMSSCALIVAVGAVAVYATQRSTTAGSWSESPSGRPQIGNLRLSAGQSSAHFTITALSPPTHTYNVLVETAASADVSVYFQTWYGQTLGAQYSTQGTLASDCVVTGTRMACLSHFPELGAERAGPWTVIASKRSGPAVSVRVSVTFQTVFCGRSTNQCSAANP